MKAVKLPSGSYRVQVIDHYEYKNGKKVPVRVSFTHKSKKEALRRAAEFEATREGLTSALTVHDAIKRYIATKTAVLSPSTVTAYNSYLNNGIYAPIEAADVRYLKEQDVQLWVSWVSSRKSAKYTKNVYMLFAAAVKMCGGRDYNTLLPRIKKPEVYTPTDAELVALLDYIHDKKELFAAVMLAAFGSMRRSEICALTGEDFSGNKVRVNKAMVKETSGAWVIKGTKTSGSERAVVLPSFVVELIAPAHGRIVNCNPDALSNRFNRAVRFAKIPNRFTFHSLRHYYVSISHALQISEAYTMKVGGWATDSVMKRNYRSVLTDVEQREQNKLHAHFEEIAHEIAHESRFA